MNGTIVSVSQIAKKWHATAEDTAHVVSRLSDWLIDEHGQPLYTVDASNGEVHVTKEDADYVSGKLAAAIERRQEQRIESASRALAAAETAFRAAVRTKGHKRPDDGKLLALSAATTEALLELVDAKEDAGRMSPSKAADLRGRALDRQAALEQDHLTAMRGAMRRIRGH